MHVSTQLGKNVFSPSTSAKSCFTSEKEKRKEPADAGLLRAMRKIMSRIATKLTATTCGSKEKNVIDFYLSARRLALLSQYLYID